VAAERIDQSKLQLTVDGEQLGASCLSLMAEASETRRAKCRWTAALGMATRRCAIGERLNRSTCGGQNESEHGTACIMAKFTGTQ
jgi:hypothetical protein